jgi:uncharacterized protein YjbI with pentapeptide repeats
LVPSLRLSQPTGLSPHDEWNEECVVDADLSGCVADHVEIAACELRGVLLTGAELEQLRLVDVVARICEFSGSFAHQSSMVRVEFRNCRMSGLVVSDSRLSSVQFVDCKLDDANFRFATGDHVVFDRCSLVGADFYGATLTVSGFDSCDLTGAQFSKATVGGVRLLGSRLEGVRGAIGMSGVVIGSDQVLPLALSVFSDLGIVIEHEED